MNLRINESFQSPHTLVPLRSYVGVTSGFALIPLATTGGRYYGFVIDGTLPAALAANWLAGAWDQNAAMQVMSPVAAKLEEIVLEWMVDLLGLPSGSGAGFVTGTTMANFSALAAARTALLTRAGWDIEEDGLFGAPPIHVVVGDEVHVSVLKALSMLGLGKIFGQYLFSQPQHDGVF